VSGVRVKTVLCFVLHGMYTVKLHIFRVSKFRGKYFLTYFAENVSFSFVYVPHD